MTDSSQPATNSASKEEENPENKRNDDTGQEEENQENKRNGDTRQTNFSKYSHKYTTIKTIAEGSLDLALMAANISHLKDVIDRGEDYKYYYPVVVILPLVLLLQIAAGVLLCILGFIRSKDQRTKKKAEILNTTSVSLIVVITVLNLVISSL